MKVPHLIALLAFGCNMPDGGLSSLEEATWDPNNVVVAGGGLYVLLPGAGAIVRLEPGEDPVRIELDEGRVTRIAGSPDGNRMVAFVERYRCESDNADEIKRVDTLDECPQDALIVETELTVIEGTTPKPPLPVSGTYNSIAFSDDGSFAIAYVDFSQQIEVDGVLNLTGVAVVDLDAGITSPVPVGFAADRVLFSNDDGGAPTEAVVLSRSAVAVIDLLADQPDVEVTFPLTLDPDQTVEPTSVDLTPDGRYALISTVGSSDLYVLDLEQHAINIVELSAVPAELAVSDAYDRSVLVYQTQEVVELLDHQFFEVETFDLDEAMNHVALSGDNALLYGTDGQHDLYRLDLEDEDVIEYRLQNPAVSLHVSPDNAFALALTRAEGGFGDGVDALYDQNPGLEILDLQSDESDAFILEGQGLDVKYANDETSLSALILQEGIDYVYALDLYTGQATEVELSTPPIAIGSMPDGSFFITHDSPLGLVSFLDPNAADGPEITDEIGGFASIGLFDEIEIAVEGGEE